MIPQGHGQAPGGPDPAAHHSRVALALGLVGAVVLVAAALIGFCLARVGAGEPSARVVDTRPSLGGVDLTVGQLASATLEDIDVGIPESTAPFPLATDFLALGDLDAPPDCLAGLTVLEDRGARPRFGGGLVAAPRTARRDLATRDNQLDHEVADGVPVTIADYRALFPACDRIDFRTPGGRSGSMSFAPGRPVAAGDDSLSLHYELRVEGRSQEVLWVLWERDSIISSMSLTELPRGSSPRPDLVEDAVERADAKLEEVIG